MFYSLVFNSHIINDSLLHTQGGKQHQVFLLYKWLRTRTKISRAFRWLQKFSKFGTFEKTSSVCFLKYRGLFFFLLGFLFHQKILIITIFSLILSILRKWLSDIYHLTNNIFKQSQNPRQFCQSYIIKQVTVIQVPRKILNIYNLHLQNSYP